MRSPLPAMSAEERTRALEIANQARRERAELKRNMKAGRITPKTALDAKAGLAAEAVCGTEGGQ